MHTVNQSSILALCGSLCLAVAPATYAETATVSYTTTTPLSVPTRSNYAGINMQLFNSGASYRDATMQMIANSMNLGWVRFPAGTEDDVYDWTTGDTPDSSIGQFSSYPAYSEMQSDAPIVRGKGFLTLSGFTNFLFTQRTGPSSVANTSPTHVIGVINTFTDTPASAASLVQSAVAAGIQVDVWELGNEPVYFSGFYPNATTYLNAVQPYAQAIKTAVPTAKVAVWINPNTTDACTKDTAKYPRPFWDQLYTLSYPDTSKTQSTQADQISYYNGFLMNNTNSLVDNGYERSSEAICRSNGVSTTPAI